MAVSSIQEEIHKAQKNVSHQVVMLPQIQESPAVSGGLCRGHRERTGKIFTTGQS